MILRWIFSHLALLSVNGKYFLRHYFFTTNFHSKHIFFRNQSTLWASLKGWAGTFSGIFVKKLSLWHFVIHFFFSKLKYSSNFGRIIDSSAYSKCFIFINLFSSCHIRKEIKIFESLEFYKIGKLAKKIFVNCFPQMST